MEDYEEFTEEQVQILERFVTSTSSNVFVLRNLPEVIKGALFSRYSRSSLGLRSLLLKEFILGDETEFSSIVGRDDSHADQFMAIKKAQNFYDRILDGYGDDSIGELGGAHLAVENVSMLAAKALEDCRIGGSPLEKSTRYIYFDQKVKDQYLYYREPILMTSAYRDAYTQTCDMLFETYSSLIPQVTELMEKRFPKDPEMSKVAYNAALRAKVLDTLRGLLPAGTLTNMGVFGNGRFWEGLINKMQCEQLAELQETGKRCYDELSKVVPSFVRRSCESHHNHEAFSQFQESMAEQLKTVAQKQAALDGQQASAGVRLVSNDKDNVFKVAAALLYNTGDASLEELYNHCLTLSPDQIAEIFDAASSMRENRRHKSPRALEHAQFTFEIVADFGAYRDLHRHRMLTQQRQLLTTHYGYYVAPELLGTPMEKEYREAMERADGVFRTIAQELPEEAQYVVPMGYNVRWYFHVNLRALQWLCELRSTPAGHPQYRLVAQELAKLTVEAHPEFECFFKFVDFEGYELGRLGQEQRKAEKMESRKQ
ncbi:MAG: Flavin-dependent thymidylate synthase [Chlamydiales bacterium]|nr:Flavin-dependent thymidylate synthase [Chlamydiales bacterium]MCH9634857.1 Flavin-dependent thymidylate synthase [Chlamydiales bacterium]